MSTELRIAMLGMIEGNGHPYSWSGIINGYDPIAMAQCPYGGIEPNLNEPTPQSKTIGQQSLSQSRREVRKCPANCCQITCLRTADPYVLGFWWWLEMLDWANSPLPTTKRLLLRRATPMRWYRPSRFGLPPTTPIEPVRVPASAKTEPD